MNVIKSSAYLILRVLTPLLFLIPFCQASAQDSIPAQAPDYLIEGKLKMKGLPLSPSLKIFLSPDSLIDISVRAPFVGEAGRLIISPDSVLIVNKMNKSYAKEGIADFLRIYPGGISDVQDLLLAKFFLPGFIVEEAPLAELVDIYFEDNQYNVIPKGDAIIPGIRYGFVVDEFFNPLLFLVLPEDNPDSQFMAQYSYSRPPEETSIPTSSYSVLISYIEGDKGHDLTLELKAPEVTFSAPKPFELNKKFRQLSLSDFLKSF